MRNFWLPFLLSMLLANSVGATVAKTVETDSEGVTVGLRAQRRAELRSALSLPVQPDSPTEERANKSLVPEHQLSVQQRADLRRQLREQFKDVGADALP